MVATKMFSNLAGGSAKDFTYKLRIKPFNISVTDRLRVLSVKNIFSNIILILGINIW
jgi:hypothetical protein